MSVVPTKDLDALQFFETHVPIWQAAPATIGLTAALVTSLDNAAKAARLQLSAQQAAKTAAKTATNTFHGGMTALRGVGGDLIKTIKAFADTTNNPNVYNLAQIPPPAAPSPPPPLEAPEDFTADPAADGTISLKWKGSLRFSTFFSIFRRGPGEANFTQIATVAAKSFIDTAPPAPKGPEQANRSVDYLVRAQRQTEIGPATPTVTVVYGAGGQLFTSVKLVA